MSWWSSLARDRIPAFVWILLRCIGSCVAMAGESAAELNAAEVGRELKGTLGEFSCPE